MFGLNWLELLKFGLLCAFIGRVRFVSSHHCLCYFAILLILFGAQCSLNSSIMLFFAHFYLSLPITDFCCALLGSGRTQYIIHMLSLLSCSWANIWCNWVYIINRHMVSWMCSCRVASWSGWFPSSDNLPHFMFPQLAQNHLLFDSYPSCILCLYQPLFPGESAVDQLVEIIKVLQNVSKDSYLFLLHDCFLCFCDILVGPWYTNPWGNKMHEPQLHWVQVSTDQGPSMAQGIHVLHPYLMRPI